MRVLRSELKVTHKCEVYGVKNCHFLRTVPKLILQDLTQMSTLRLGRRFCYPIIVGLVVIVIILILLRVVTHVQYILVVV